jgi:MFS family permease
MISDLFPRDQLGRAIAVYSVGLPVGSGLALLIGGLAVAMVAELPPVVVPWVGELRPWQLTFLLVGLPGVVVALLVMLMREPVRRDRLRASPAPDGAAPGLLAHLREHRRVLAHHFGGLSLLVVIVYGATAWIPTFFMRVHGWSGADIGYAYGIIFMTCGTGGLLAGGLLADRWWRAGRSDAHLRVVLWSVATMTPCFALLPLAPSAEVAVALLALATFTSSLHGGVAGAALQLITPNELRGQMTAVYFFIANLVGLGLGPTAVALITDFVLVDPLALGASIGLLAVISGPVSVVLLATGLPFYRRSAERLASLTRA